MSSLGLIPLLAMAQKTGTTPEDANMGITAPPTENNDQQNQLLLRSLLGLAGQNNYAQPPEQQQSPLRTILQAIIPLAATAGLGALVGGGKGAYAGKAQGAMQALSGYSQQQNINQQMALEKQKANNEQMNQVLNRIINAANVGSEITNRSETRKQSQQQIDAQIEQNRLQRLALEDQRSKQAVAGAIDDFNSGLSSIDASDPETLKKYIASIAKARGLDEKQTDLLKEFAGQRAGLKTKPKEDIWQEQTYKDWLINNPTTIDKITKKERSSTKSDYEEYIRRIGPEATAKAAEDTMPNPSQIDGYAMLLIDKKMAPSQFAQIVGRYDRKTGAEVNRRVVDSVTRLDPNYNWMEAESNFQFGKSTQTQNRVRAIENLTNKGGAYDILKDVSDKVKRTPAAYVNRPLLLVLKNIGGDPAVAAYQAVATEVQMESAFAMSMGGQMSDERTRLAGKMIDPDLPIESLDAVLDASKRILFARKESITKGTYMEVKPTSEDKTTKQELEQYYTKHPEMRPKAR